MYIEAEPVVVLFYETICNRSTRINRFLNLTQAIEVYSYRYREDDTKNVAQVREGTKKDKKLPVHLNHRLEDAFSIVSASLGIDESRIPALSKTIADMRNYFTHYNAGKYIKPSYQEMLAGCHVLELVLLAIIYRHIGIPEKDIKACKRMVEFQRFDWLDFDRLNGVESEIREVFDQAGDYIDEARKSAILSAFSSRLGNLVALSEVQRPTDDIGQDVEQDTAQDYGMKMDR